MFQQIMVLLQVNADKISIPLISVYGVILAGVIALLGFLLRDAYKALKEKQSSGDSRLDEFEEKHEADIRDLDKRINDLHINILNRLDDIKDKFNEFRK